MTVLLNLLFTKILGTRRLVSKDDGHSVSNWWYCQEHEPKQPKEAVFDSVMSRAQIQLCSLHGRHYLARNNATSPAWPAPESLM